MKTPSEDRIAAAKNSRVSNLLGRFSGALNRNNRRDDYTLTIARRGRFSASLQGLQSNAALELWSNNGRRLARSDRPGRKPESIQKRLNPGTYFIRVLQRAGRTRYRLTLNGRPNSPAAKPTPTPSSTPFQNLWGEYRGSGVTTNEVFDLRSGRSTGEKNSYPTNIIARVAAPSAAGGIVETNPFSLSVSSPYFDLLLSRTGSIALYSASRGTQGVLKQSWSLQYNGNQINGTLTNPGTVFNPAAPNYFVATGSSRTILVGTPLNFPMQANTTLQGTLTPTELRLQIQSTYTGTATNTSRIFVSDIIAQRV